MEFVFLFLAVAGSAAYVILVLTQDSSRRGGSTPFAGEKTPEGRPSTPGGPSYLILDELQSLSGERARELAKHEGDLYLRGLTELSDEAAEALAEHKHALFLQGLNALSLKSARSLAQHRGKCLLLCGLSSLSESTARAIASYSGKLYLNGLTSVSVEVAEALARHEGLLSLEGLTNLPCLELAERLAQDSTGGLKLNGLTELSGEIARVLAQHKGSLSLDGLTTLSDEAAKALASHEGDLCLNGLTSLSDEAARALVEHEGDLDLRGLTQLTEDLGRALVQCNGALDLRGVADASREAVTILAQHEGDLCLGLSVVADDIADRLSCLNGSLSLPGLQAITHPRLARKLLEQASHLEFDYCEWISDAVADVFGDSEVEICLYALRGLSYRSCAALRRNSNANWDGGPIAPEGGYGFHDRAIGRCVTAELAAVLAEKAGDLSLEINADLSPQEALALSSHDGELSIAFERGDLSADAAEHLARVNGRLSIEGLAVLSGPVARALSRHCGELVLDEIASVTDEAYAELSEHPACWVNWNRITPGQNYAIENLGGYVREMRSAAVSAARGSEKIDGSSLTDDRIRDAVLVHAIGVDEKGRLLVNELRNRHILEELVDLLRHDDDDGGVRAGDLGPAAGLQNLPADRNEIKTLTVNQAYLLASQHEGYLPLNGLNSLTGEIAGALAQHTGTLSLNGLSTLSDEAAAALAEHKGRLCLNGVATLTSEATKALSKLGDYPLELNNLSALSAEQAQVLGQRRGLLTLDGLQVLSDEAAIALAEHEGGLSLNSLGTFPCVALATTLVRWPGDDSTLSLDGVTSVSAEVAEALARHEGWLALNGLNTLAPEAARALSQHKGGLGLNGLTALPCLELAEKLAEDELGKDGTGDLLLNGLTELPGEVAQALAQHKGNLSLNGLTTLSDEAADALGGREGNLWLSGLNSITPEVAAALAKHQGSLALNSLSEITPEVAEALAKHRGELSLGGLAEIKPVVELILRSNTTIRFQDR